MRFISTFLTLYLAVLPGVLSAPVEKRGFDYITSALEAHNVHRSNHSASDLVWDDDLANYAQTWAEMCTFAHNTSIGGGGYGQNLALGNSNTSISTSISDQWYNNEVSYYSSLYGEAQPSMTNFEDWGHFSQLVWKDTMKVGCATINCPNGVIGFTSTQWNTVCNYGPSGNYANQYGENVGKPLGQASVYGGDGK